MQNNNKKVEAEKLFSPMKFFSLPKSYILFYFFPSITIPGKNA